RVGELLAARGLELHAEVEPLFATAGGSHFAAGRDAFDVLVQAPVEPFLERDLPLALQAREITGEEGEHGVLAVELEPAFLVGAFEAGADEAGNGVAFGGEIAEAVATRTNWIGHPWKDVAFPLTPALSLEERENEIG